MQKHNYAYINLKQKKTQIFLPLFVNHQQRGKQAKQNKIFSPFLFETMNQQRVNKNNAKKIKNENIIFIVLTPFCLKQKQKPNRGDNQLRYQLKICQSSILIPIESKHRSINKWYMRYTFMKRKM